MQVANYPRNADREERRARETLGRYRSREYVRRYKAEYTNGLGPKHVRSRVVAAGEKAAIAQLLREIDPAGSALLDVPCGTGKLGPLLQTFPVHVVAADVSREMLASVFSTSFDASRAGSCSSPTAMARACSGSGAQFGPSTRARAAVCSTCP